MTLKDLKESRKLTNKEMANAMGISVWKYQKRENNFVSCKAIELSKLYVNLNLSDLELRELTKNI